MRVGIDLIAIKKFRNIRESDYEKWRHVFTQREWAWAFRDVHAPQHLAGIFAVKEAAMKASHAAGIDNFQKFEVIHAADRAPRLNHKKYAVSISHDQHYAIAVVIGI